MSSAWGLSLGSTAELVGVVLAAGKGTRLGELTADRPKPMVEVAGKSCLEHILVGIRRAGIERIALIVGYKAEAIRAAFGDGSRLGVRLTYIHQQQLNGTGGAVHLAREFVGDRPFLLAWGDILISPENYAGIARQFTQEPCDALIGVNWVDDPYQGAAVNLDEQNRVTRIVEKPPHGASTTHWNNAGLACFHPTVFQYTGRLTPSQRGELELPRALQEMLQDGLVVKGYPLQGYWGDIGTPEELERMSKLLQEEMGK